MHSLQLLYLITVTFNSVLYKSLVPYHLYPINKLAPPLLPIATPIFFKQLKNKNKTKYITESFSV